MAADLSKTTAVAVLELSRLGRLTDETYDALSDAVDPKVDDDQADDDAGTTPKTATPKGAAK